MVIRIAVIESDCDCRTIAIPVISREHLIERNHVAMFGQPPQVVLKRFGPRRKRIFGVNRVIAENGNAAARPCTYCAPNGPG
jgi:hypothetical protein